MIKYIILLLALMFPIKATKATDRTEPLRQEDVIAVLRHLANTRTLITEKTADQILAENQDNPEFMSCSKWLQMEFSNFSEEKVLSHPFFPLLKEAIQLADFEVDTLEEFVHTYMETNMAEEQAQSLMTFRKNSMAAKYFVGDLINLLERKNSIQNIIEIYLKDRFQCIISYRAELAQKTKTVIDVSKCETKSLLQTSDPIYESMKNGFLRSYNIKNKIIRELLYSLKNQEKKPLTSCLSPMLANLLRLSASLHPFFNKENDQWLDQDNALQDNEDRDFLGNAKELRINLKELFKKEGIKDFKIPKFGYRKIGDIPLPNFLTEGGMEEDPSLFETSKKSKRKKNTKTPKNKVQKPASTFYKEAASLPVDENNKSDSPLEDDCPEEHTPSAEALSTPSQEMHILPQALIIASDASLMKAESTEPQLNSTSHLPKIKQTAGKSSSYLEEQKEKIRNKHIETIYDIFRPKGYKRLNGDRIIKAWKHLLKERGYHKENTGRSHQPLYATLHDGSQVVFGLFMSSSYGPRYVNYIREAFEKIGFGKGWLKQQGYESD